MQVTWCVRLHESGELTVRRLSVQLTDIENTPLPVSSKLAKDERKEGDGSHEESGDSVSRVALARYFGRYCAIHCDNPAPSFSRRR